MTTRYGQLGYTSFDKPGSAGGWQIKQVGGALNEEEVQALLAGVRTTFDPVDPLPSYPTAEQLERIPRRLAYRHVDAGRAGYWHTVPAGSDSTGRPGNVFAHAVLDRTPDVAPRHRPIQRWRSPLWVCPYGAVAVASAVLPDQAPEPAAAVTKDSVVAFALDTRTWRLATLFGLLDAVAAALDGGAPVVLGVETADAAAQWIGLVSFLMSPGTAARLNFSTFDRAHQLGLALQSKQHLSAVPVVDLAAVPAGVVVIDETATLSLGELGREPHRTAAGQPIAVTPWSAMAQVVLLESGSARAVLNDIDRFASQTEDTALPPAWPMAMAVATADEYADAHAEAHSVIAAHTPRGAGSAVHATMTEVVNAMVGTSTADAWNAVQHAPPGLASAHADLTYLRRAIKDDVWLSQLGPVPVGPRRIHRPPTDFSTEVGSALEQARDVGPDQVLRLVDFLMRSGVDDEQCSAALHRDVVASLCDSKCGARLVHRLGQRIGTVARLALAAESLKVTGHRDGFTELSDDVLDWLGDGITAPAPSELAQARPWDDVWNRAALRGARAQHLGAAAAAERWVWLWWLRICGSQRFEQMAAEEVWEPAELLAAAGGAPPGLSAVPTLVGAPDSAALAELAAAVVKANAEDTAVACAYVRLLEPRIWVQEGHIESYLPTYTPHVDAALTVLGPDRLHPDFTVRLLTLAVVATIAGQPYPAGCATLAAEPALAADAVAQVVTLVDDHVVIPAAVLAASLVRTSAHEESGKPAAGVDELLARAAQQLAVTRDFADQEVEDAAVLMAKMSGAEPDGSSLRRNRRLVAKLVALRAQAQPSLATRIRENR